MNYAHIKAHIARRNGSPPNATNAATTTVAQPAADPSGPTPTETLSRDRYTNNRPAWVVDRENAKKAARNASSAYHQAKFAKAPPKFGFHRTPSSRIHNPHPASAASPFLWRISYPTSTLTSVARSTTYESLCSTTRAAQSPPATSGTTYGLLPNTPKPLPL